MNRQKKNMGCLGILIYLIFLIIIFNSVVALLFYGIILVGIIFLSIYFFKLIVLSVKKIYLYVKQKYDERILSGKPTFIRKFLDILNMDNCGTKNDFKNDDTLEITSEIIPINEIESNTDEVIENYITEPIQESELQIITIEENNTSINVKNDTSINIKNDTSIHTKNDTIIRTPLPKQTKETPSPTKRKPKPQRKYMSQYDIEQFAKECNAYIIREERKEQQERARQKRE